jgi:hypothetical protein
LPNGSTGICAPAAPVVVGVGAVLAVGEGDGAVVVGALVTLTLGVGVGLWWLLEQAVSVAAPSRQAAMAVARKMGAPLVNVGGATVLAVSDKTRK